MPMLSVQTLPVRALGELGKSSFTALRLQTTVSGIKTSGITDYHLFTTTPKNQLIV